MHMHASLRALDEVGQRGQAMRNSLLWASHRVKPWEKVAAHAATSPYQR